MHVKIFQNLNIYDKAIILLIMSTAFGNVGGSLQIIRLLALILFPLFVITQHKVRRILKPFLVFFTLLGLYATLSLLWSPDFTKGVKELLYYVIHILIFLEIITFAYFAKKTLNAISLGWSLAVFLTLFVAYWEIITGQHLSYSSLDADDMAMKRVKIQFAAVAFYNYNCYVTFLTLAMSFLFFRLLIVKGKIWSLLVLVLILLSIIVVVFNASRGGIVTILVILGLFVLRSIKNNVIIMAFLSTIVFYVILHYGELIFTGIMMRMEYVDLFDGSSRFNVWYNSWNYFKESLGFGLGIGSVPSVTGIPASHNIFLEILMQFGVIFCLIFICFLYKTFERGIKLKNRDLVTTIVLFYTSFPIIGIINSNYLIHAFVYCAFASIYTISNYENIRCFNMRLCEDA